jgi:hypothetical protein
MHLPEWLKRGPTGSLTDFEPGTVERAKIVTLSLLFVGSRKPLPNSIGKWKSAEPKKENAHGLLGFHDFDAYLEGAIGKTEAEASKRFEHGNEVSFIFPSDIGNAWILQQFCLGGAR